MSHVELAGVGDMQGLLIGLQSRKVLAKRLTEKLTTGGYTFGTGGSEGLHGVCANKCASECSYWQSVTLGRRFVLASVILCE